ncbi:MAG: OmpA family protein [Flavobacteriaceae bacterium]|nr:OmpA family protein [Flavobacteriaceae bacterium]
MKNLLFFLFIIFSINSFAQEPDRFVNIQNLDINTKLADFGVSFYKNDFVLFASSKKDRDIRRKDRSHNRMGYLEFYKGLIGDDGQIILAGQFSLEKYNVFHESDITFTPDGKSIYFTLNNYIDDDYHEKFKKSTTKKHILNIFKASVDDAGIVTNVKPVPFNGKNYSVRNPELSPDGKTLYFSSDMDGGFGDFDIYQVSVHDDGTYGEPKNLGKKINTKYNEFFPFLSTNNIFYFSSDGHGGGGFLDIFSSNLINGSYSTPQNIDKVNSEYDDFAFVISPEQGVGYFSSSKEGKGNADIYSFTIEPIICDQVVTGVIKDKQTEKVIPNATVELFSEGKLLDVIVTQENGAFSFNTTCETAYRINATKSIHTTDSQSFTTSNINEENVNITLYIEPLDCNQSIAGIVSSEKTNIPLIDVELSLLYKGELIEKTRSQIGGLFNFNTQVDCKSDYKIITEAKNYASKTKSFSTSEKLDGENYLDIKLKETDEFITYRNITMIKTKPIYFDLNESTVREDAARELDKVVQIMKKYPEIKIELNSHTDSRAPDAYNMRLSQERAASSIAYIISRGIDESRIFGRGYGETRLRNKCSNGVKCTETEHQKNRRTEFIVINE